MLMATLGAILLANMFAGNRVIQVRKRTIRAGQDF